MWDYVSFILLSGFTLTLVAVTMPRSTNIFSILLFLFLIIPTLVALVSGAPFVPTPINGVRKLLKVAKVKKGDKVVDIGCGDGRMVYLAAKEHGAQAIGYELSPLVFIFAKVRQYLWKSQAKIKFGDFRMHNLSDVDHIVTYMLPETLRKFIPKFEKELQEGARVTSYAFKIGDWKPIHIEPTSREEAISKIYVYEIGKHI